MVFRWEKKNHNFMKKGSKSGLMKTFGPNLGLYTKNSPQEFMIPEFHGYPLEPKNTKCGDLLYSRICIF